MTSQVTQALSALYESVDYGLELITPEQAQFYLEKNFDNNRKISTNNLEELKKEMKNNRFILSDSAICFDTDGLLVNGQHRLLAFNGLNDLWNLHNKKGIPSPDYVGENILKITKIIHTESPATKIYVQTILPTRNDFLMNNIIAVNKIIKLNGKQGIYKVIDLNSIFLDSNGLLIEEMTYDDAHLNEKGYLRWTEYVKEIVLSNID